MAEHQTAGGVKPISFKEPDLLTTTNIKLSEARNWVNHMEVYMQVHNVPLEKEAFYASMYMRGKVFKWAQTLREKKNILAWRPFKEELLKLLTPPNHEFEMKKAYSKLSQTGSVRAFNNEFRDLLKEQTEEYQQDVGQTMTDYLVKLTDEIRQFVQCRPYNNLEQLMAVAQDVESKSPMPKIGNKGFENENQTSFREQDNQFQRGTKRFRANMAHHQYAPRTNGNARANVRCYLCNELGHYKRDCPKHGRGGGGVKLKPLKVGTILSGQQGPSVRTTDCPVVMGQVGPHRVTMEVLLDTGASKSYINLGDVYAAKIPLHKLPQNVSLMGALSNRSTVVTQAVIADLTLCGHELKGISLLAVKGLQGKVILGYDHLRKNPELLLSKIMEDKEQEEICERSGKGHSSERLEAVREDRVCVKRCQASATNDTVTIYNDRGTVEKDRVRMPLGTVQVLFSRVRRSQLAS